MSSLHVIHTDGMHQRADVIHRLKKQIHADTPLSIDNICNAVGNIKDPAHTHWCFQLLADKAYFQV